MLKNEENGAIYFEASEKIETLSVEKWEYWLSELTPAYDVKTGCGTVYKAPLTDKDRADIRQFKEEIRLTISSGIKKKVDRVNRIIELMTDYQADFEKFYPFTHFYILFEFSPEKPMEMGEMGDVIMELTELLKDGGLAPTDYFWAAESVKDLGNNLKITVQAGR